MPKGERGTSRPFLPTKHTKIWWIKYYVDGKPKYESSKSENKQDAVRLLNQRRKQIDDRHISSGEATISDLLDLFLADLRKQKRKGYKEAEGYVRIHLRPAFGKIKTAQFTSGMIDRFIEQKQKQTLTNASINRYLSALRRAFQLGLEALPPLVMIIPKIVKLEEDNVREGFLEHDQYVTLRGELPFHQQMILVIGYHLGMRRGEILQLRWDQVDWAENVIRLEKKQTKAKQARTAPLYGELRAWFELARTASDQCPHIVSYEGHGISENKRAWKRARIRAGLPDLLVHDLRRTAIRNMIRAGIPEKQAMLISGHKTRSVFDRYNIIDERDVHEAGEKLTTYLERKARESAEQQVVKQVVKLNPSHASPEPVN